MVIKMLKTRRGVDAKAAKPSDAVQKACDDALGAGWVLVAGNVYRNIPASAGAALVKAKDAEEVN